MKIPPFATERFFARYEFTAPHILCASDCETLTVGELLQLAGSSLDEIAALRLGYTESQGDPALRERIAAMYEQVTPDDVIALGAPEEGIFIAMHALLEPGDEVIVLSPCYDSLRNVATYLGCSVVRWNLEEAAEPPQGPGGWRLDLDGLRHLLSDRTALVVANFPHNPTGALPAHDDWLALVEMVGQAGARLFSDEMYRGLEYDPSTRLRSGCDLGKHVLTLSGLSKTYGLPGLRSGWLITRDRQLRDELLGWKDYTTICASAASERLAETALRVADALADRSLAIVLSNLELADGFFARWSRLFRWNRPKAGSVALVGQHHGSARDLAQEAVTSHGVVLLPGTCLGSDDHHFRIGLGRRDFATCLGRFEEFLEAR